MSEIDDFEADEARLAQAERELDQASTDVDRAWDDLQRAERAQSRASSDTPRRQYTPEEMEKGKEMLEKVAEVGLKSVATVAAVAGASVVSIFKRDTSAIESTFGWCKKNFWGSK